MAININDLPLKYQAQAAKKYLEQQQRKSMLIVSGPPETVPASKFHNKRTERVTADGNVIRFDSRKEACRYDHLAALLRSGQIRDLRLQVDFTLQEAFTDPEGHRSRALRYRADFTYWENDRLVVEDVKSQATRTKEYIIKRKLMKDRLGIDITEV